MKMITDAGVEGNFAGYENYISWYPRVQNLLDPPDQGVKTYVIVHWRGHMVQKPARQVWQGMKLFRPSLRNVIFRTCIVVCIVVKVLYILYIYIMLHILYIWYIYEYIYLYIYIHIHIHYIYISYIYIYIYIYIYMRNLILAKN